MIAPPPDLAAAYEYCARLVRAHDENFPVASRLLPADMRPHVAAIYAFARIADDLADEGDLAVDERYRLLAEWRDRLHAAVSSSPGESRHGKHQPVFDALGHTVASRAVPVSLLEDLVSAFEQDVETARYSTWDEVLDYCRRSANPVGRIVLRIAGCATPELDSASDSVCTALQLTNFWQDLEGDWHRGRLYVPTNLLAEAGASTAELDARRLGPEWRWAMERVTALTRDLFHDGRQVCDGVPGRLGWELRCTWLGGMAILDRLEASGFDVFDRRPTLGWLDYPRILWEAGTWRPHASPGR